jgi:signal transduction histidine kinase/ligand-binding sensor domain-containing protein/DNA-binding response OmpR family regulator
MSKQRILILCLILFWGNVSFSQSKLPPKLKFNSLNVEDGLSNNIINTITQDSLGFIWIGTNDGLSRFDGNNFKIFRKSFEDPNSISNNFIQSLFVDSKGDLWIMTDQGLNKYDIEKELFEVFLADNENGLSHNSVTTMVERHTNDFYIGSYGGGIDVLKKEKFVYNYSNNNDDNSISSNLISSLRIQNDSILWVGNWHEGLNKINLNNNQVKRYDFGPNAITLTGEINTLYLDKNDYLWIGTNSGLSVLNTKDDSYFRINQKNCPTFSDNDILSILEDKDGIMWLGTRNSGILTNSRVDIITNQNKASFNKYLPNNNGESVYYRSISSFHQDNQGNIWIGTHLAGANIVNPKGESLRLYNHFSNLEESLSSKSVWGISEDDQNNIWVGTDGGGLYKFNPFNNKIESFQTDPNSVNSISDNAVLSSCFDSQGNLWFGTYAGGINKMNPNDRSFKRYERGLDSNDLNSNDIRVIFEDSSNRIWIGTNGEGLHLYKPETDDFEFITEVGWIDIRALTEDAAGNLWIGTFGNGILSYNHVNDKIKRYEAYDKLNAHIVFTIAFSDSDNLWVGTRYEGLLQFNLKTNKIFQYTEKNGLSNNTIQSIVPESSNYLWISTNNGINLFDLEKKNFINYNTTSNIQPGAFNNNSGFLSKNGYVVFGGINGLNVFYPEELKREDTSSKIVFTDFKLYNSSIKVSTESNKTALDQSISSLKELKLKHNEDVVTIDYVALNFPSAKNINYAYKLENYEDHWNKVGTSTSATYRNLSPGEYVFRVMVTDEEQQSKTLPASLKIVITPPFWLTLPAILFYIVAIILIVFLIARYYTNQVKLRNSLFYEQKLRLQESSLNIERFRFFTSFSHELRTPLTLILGPVKDIINVETNKKKKNRLNLIHRNAQILLELINKLLEFRKTETEHNHLVLGHHSFNKFIEEIYENFSLYAEQKGIDFRLNIERDFYIWFDYKKILIVINNVLSNAFKYTKKKGVITIEVNEEKEDIMITISDSGIGIKEEAISSIFELYYHGDDSDKVEGTGIGLALCKKLLELHRGEISVESKRGKGTSFLIKLNKTKEHYLDIKNVEFVEHSELLINKPFIKESNLTPDLIDNSEFSDDDKVLLIVDDNVDVVNYVGEIMSNQYKIITAIDGQEGIDKAKSIIPDLIISDVMMPEKSGIDLCYELKNCNQTSHIPIVLLTAKFGIKDKFEATKIGADDYISKPFDSQYLITRIDNLFKNRKRLIEHYKSLNINSGENNEKSKSVEEIFLEKLEKSILVNYNGSDISIPKLAENLGFSRSSLYRKVKAITGLSINHYVRKVRLDNVAKLISERKLNVSEAAYEMGFNDLKYFRICFKEQFGVVPSEYKRNNEQAYNL